MPAAVGHAAGTRSSVSGHPVSRRAAISARAASLRTTPALVRAGTGAVALAAAALASVIAVAASGVSGSLSSMGGTQAPQVQAATGLYFALNDMDAQIANVLLAAAGLAPSAARGDYLAAYARDREAAYADLQQAAVTAAGNAAAERQLRLVLDRTGQYEALAADALLASQQGAAAGPGTGGAAGTAPAAGYYRQATDLMRTGILPQVSSLAGVSSARLDADYAAGRSAARAGMTAAIVAGLVLLAVLAGLQAFLARRFRRRVNPALAAATLAALVMVAAAAARLDAGAGHLKVAKQDAFDSVVALSQARAVSYAANADESRYLADPGRAAMYQQSFLARSQQLAAVGNAGAGGPPQYEAALDEDVHLYQVIPGYVRFGGYLGAEFRNITFPGERAAAEATLLAYQRYQRDDGQLRALARTSPRAAAEFDAGTRPGQSDWAFGQYDQALSALIGINQRAFTAAVAAGEGGGAAWGGGAIPAGGAALVVALALLGVRPRLAEYRR
jgi:hypothetical protein